MFCPVQNLILIEMDNQVTKDLVAKVLNWLHDSWSQSWFEYPVWEDVKTLMEESLLVYRNITKMCEAKAKEMPWYGYTMWISQI